MRPCTFQNENERSEIAKLTAEFLASGKNVEHFQYMMPSKETLQLERRKNGTLKGGCNSRFFER